MTNSHINDYLVAASTGHQPEHNCTAAVVIGIYLVWITIPCDAPLNASFACQSDIKMKYRPYDLAVNPYNVTCAAGSILFNSEKCYMFLEVKKQITFSTAMQMCHAQQGTILNVDVATREGSRTAHDLLLREYYHSIERRYKKAGYDIDEDGFRIKKMIFGEFLRSNSMANRLANILKWTLNDLPVHRITTLVAVKYRFCAILEYLEYARAYQAKILPDLLKGWGVKPVACGELFSIDAIVCATQSIPFAISSCGKQLFECKDGTCILYAYRCDFINDCFDNSDEDNCEAYQQNTRRLLQSINIGCESKLNCSLPHHQSTIFLQDICDGIFSAYVFVSEKQVCHNNGIVKINLLDMQYNRLIISNRWREHIDDDRIFKAVMMAYKQNVTVGRIPAFIRQTYQGKVKFRKLLCNPHTHTYIDDICKIGSHSKLCSSGPTADICTDIMCPGMLKCYGYYCIPVSYVCDGQSDCLYGEDEAYCDSLTCPGSIKCRGEKRCVGSEDICDGITNCLYSFDDEVSCHICPDNCTCEGYMVSCVAVNTQDKHTSRLFYSKGLSLNSTLGQFSIDYLHMMNLLYLDISQCSLSDVVFTSKYDIVPRLLHVNISSNFLVNINFMANHFFLSVLIIDGSNNFLTHIHLEHILFKYLTVFILGGNFIKEVHLKNTLSSLRFLKLKHVRFNPHMLINVPTLCNVIVSYPSLCCTLPSKSICRTFDHKKVTCFGLLPGLVSRICIYTIIILSGASCIFKLYRSIFDISWIKDHKLFYIATTANYSIADLLSIVYSVVLISADISRIGWLLWRKSLFCRYLRGIISLSLRGSLIYKTICLVIITLKIIFPFRHQLRWLKYLPLFSFFIWIMLVGLDVTSAHIMSDIYLDQFCTFLNCHDRHDELTYLISGRVAIDFVCIISFIVCLCKTYLYLEQRRSLTSYDCLQSTKQIYITKISFKLGKLLYSDIVLRTIFFLVYIIKHTYSLREQFCLAIALYTIPLNILIFNIANAFWQHLKHNVAFLAYGSFCNTLFITES